MTWFEDHWRSLRFNRLDFDRKYVVDQVLSQTPRSRVVLVRRRGGSRQTVMKLSDWGTFNPLQLECLRSVNHPGIVTYLGHGLTKDRRLWFETEYVDGMPLSAWLSGKESQLDSLPSGTANDVSNSMDVAAPTILSRLIAVVQYLHCCGWLHGDLSPQNILVSKNQRNVLLVDFEHVRSIHSGAAVPRRKHSLAYASPQELDGGATTEACEQYALGRLGLQIFAALPGSIPSDIELNLNRATGHDPQGRETAIQHVAQFLETFLPAD